MYVGGQQIGKVIGRFPARLDPDNLVAPGVAAGEFNFHAFTDRVIAGNQLQIACPSTLRSFPANRCPPTVCWAAGHLPIRVPG